MKNTFVIFNVGAGHFGVDIQSVVSIEKLTEFTSYPQMPKYVQGIVNIRGKVIPIIDTSSLLFDREILENEQCRLILIDHHDTSVALLVQRTNEITEIAQNEILPPVSLSSDKDSYIKGIVVQEHRLITLVDVENILSSLPDIKEIRDQISELNNSEIDLHTERGI